MEQCLICGSAIEPSRKADYGDKIYFDCPTCGHFGLRPPTSLLTRLNGFVPRHSEHAQVLAQVEAAALDVIGGGGDRDLP